MSVRHALFGCLLVGSACLSNEHDEALDTCVDNKCDLVSESTCVPTDDESDKICVQANGLVPDTIVRGIATWKFRSGEPLNEIVRWVHARIDSKNSCAFEWGTDPQCPRWSDEDVRRRIFWQTLLEFWDGGVRSNLDVAGFAAELSRLNDSERAQALTTTGIKAVDEMCHANAAWYSEWVCKQLPLQSASTLRGFDFCAWWEQVNASVCGAIERTTTAPRLTRILAAPEVQALVAVDDMDTEARGLECATRGRMRRFPLIDQEEPNLGLLWRHKNVFGELGNEVLMLAARYVMREETQGNPCHFVSTFDRIAEPDGDNRSLRWFESFNNVPAEYQGQGVFKRLMTHFTAKATVDKDYPAFNEYFPSTVIGQRNPNYWNFTAECGRKKRAVADHESRKCLAHTPHGKVMNALGYVAEDIRFEPGSKEKNDEFTARFVQDPN